MGQENESYFWRQYEPDLGASSNVLVRLHALFLEMEITESILINGSSVSLSLLCTILHLGASILSTHYSLERAFPMIVYCEKQL